MKYAWSQQHATEFAVGAMCRFLQVSRSAYYDWLHRVPSTSKKDDAALTVILQSEFNKSRATYGTRRLKAALLGPGADGQSPANRSSYARGWVRR